jgi:hypothetical protein
MGCVDEVFFDVIETGGGGIAPCKGFPPIGG